MRELQDWLTGYLKYTENSEPPTTYQTWCGLSLIAGALQRKVCLHWGFEEIYPNLYVVLVGPAGRARKGVALGIAKKMLLAVPGVCVAPEEASRQAIILAMKRAASNYEDPLTGKIRTHCSLSAFSEELSVLLGHSNIELLSNLTDWYDSKDPWSYETIGRGQDTIDGVCFNLLGATAPEWIQSMLPPEAIGGGFTSRVIFIVEEKKGRSIPKHIITPEEINLQAALSRDLERINQLHGQFYFSPAGEDAYTSWYSEQDRLLNFGKQAVEDSRFASYCERRATHLRKVMMLLSASRGDSLTLDLEDFERALKFLLQAEIKMPWTFGGLGKARYGDATEKIIQFIQKVHTATRSSLLAKFYHDIDSVTLQEVERTMEEMKVVEITYLTNNRDKLYRWIGKQE
jgi:hypothetical protein